MSHHDVDLAQDGRLSTQDDEWDVFAEHGFEPYDEEVAQDFDDPYEPQTVPSQQPKNRRQRLPVVLFAAALLLVVFGSWSVREALSVKHLIASAPTSVPAAVSVVATMSLPDEKKEPEALAQIQEEPLACTDFKLLHEQNTGPGPNNCYTVGCEEGYTASMKLVGSVWHPCSS